MSFFIRKVNKNFNKRKVLDKELKFKKVKKKQVVDEEIDSDEEVINKEKKESVFFDENPIQIESIENEQQQKIILTKDYLNNLQDINKLEENDEKLNYDTINNALKEDVLKKLGTLYTNLADSLENVNTNDIFFLKNGHKLSITCCVVSSDNKYIFSVSKDASIIKWDLEKRKKLKIIKGGKKSSESTHIGHTTCINALALTTDSKFLATGCNKNFINIWNSNLEFLHRFTGHNSHITGLVFRKYNHLLYSISKDRSLRVWDLDTMCYVQTLFGHQETITSIDMLIKERAISSGGFDSTIRLWKIAEETQLVYQENGESIECVKYIDEQHFISGNANGKIALWNIQKKKSLYFVEKAHGEDSLSGTPRWIVSICTCPFSDVFATGSWDGWIRLWKHKKDKFELLFTIPLVGFVNSLNFADEGKILIVGLGQEHRLGRWWSNKDCKNSVVIIPLKK